MTKYVTTDTPNTLFAVDDDGGKIKGIVSNNGEFSGVTPHYPSKAAMPLPTSNDGRPWQCQVGGTVYKTDGVNPWVKFGEPRITTWANRGLAADYADEQTFFTDLKVTGFSDGVNWFVNSKKLKKSNVGTRILTGKTGTFDNTTVKTFRSIFELAVDGFERVRPIYINGQTGATYTVASVNARAVATADLAAVMPTPVNGTLPSGGVVPVAAATDRRSYLVGDWIDLPSIPRTDGGLGCLVCFDSYISTAGTIGTAQPTSGALSLKNWATRANRKALFAYNNGDCVTTPANFTSTVSQFTAPCIGVQYQSRGQVITVMGVGDSITEGAGAQVTMRESFLLLAAEQAQAATGIPVEFMNCGVSSTQASQFKYYIEDAVAAGLIPSICIFPNLSPNSLGASFSESNLVNGRTAVNYMHNVCADNNIPAVFWTILPANTATKDWNSSDALRVGFNAETQAYPGYTSLDLATAISGVTDAFGQIQFVDGATTDGLHPNDAGNAILAPVVADYLVAVI